MKSYSLAFPTSHTSHKSSNEASGKICLEGNDSRVVIRQLRTNLFFEENSHEMINLKCNIENNNNKDDTKTKPLVEVKFPTGFIGRRVLYSRFTVQMYWNPFNAIKTSVYGQNVL